MAMDRTGLIGVLKEMIEEDRDEPLPELEESTTLRAGLGLDSVDLLTLVLQVQDRFKVVLDSNDLENVTTVGEFVNLMQEKLDNPAQAA